MELASGMLEHSKHRQRPTPTSAPAAKPQTAPAAKIFAGSRSWCAEGTRIENRVNSAKPRSQSPLVLKTDKDKVSYALGMNLGANLKRTRIDIDTAIFLRARERYSVGHRQDAADG